MKPNTATTAGVRKVPSKHLGLLMSILAGLTGKEINKISPIEFITLEGFPDIEVTAEIDVREGELSFSLGTEILGTFSYGDEEVFFVTEEGRWAITDLGPRLAFMRKLAEVCEPLIADYTL